MSSTRHGRRRCIYHSSPPSLPSPPHPPFLPYFPCGEPTSIVDVKPFVPE
jgi:hypothetical protein